MELENTKRVAYLEVKIGWKGVWDGGKMLDVLFRALFI